MDPSDDPAAEDGFTSISWDSPSPAPAQSSTTGHPSSSASASDATLTSAAHQPGLTPDHHALPGHAMDQPMREGIKSRPSWRGRWLVVSIKDPVREHEGSKDSYVSYAVRSQTNLPGFPDQPVVVRRRFQDFSFLREHLHKTFQASVVPPIPDKHRIGYIKGDRFSPEFVEHRRIDLQHFIDRIARHPILQQSPLVSDFLQSTQWNVDMHKHISNPPPDSHTSLMDSLSDTFINAFSRVRKPDERFLDMREGIDKFEEGLGGIERLANKERGRTEDLAQDYTDMAAAYQGLGYLESGITDPLNRFAERMLDFSTLLKQLDTNTLDPFLAHTHSLIQYSQSHRSVIKMRDQKQLDFEELSAYLSAVVAERDRLAALSTGHVGGAVGLGTYLRDQVDRLRGTDDIHTRRERVRKLDGKIKELEDAVTTAHEVSTDFNEAILREHTIFEISKRAEMKEMLGTYADGQVDLYRKAIEDWDRIIPLLERIKVDV